MAFSIKFSSARERKLWLFSFAVVMAIAMSLFINREIIGFFGNQYLQGAVFLLGMLMIASALFLNVFRSNIRFLEIAVWIGIAAVYLMLFLRLGLAERSHLMEYSVLAMLVHQALEERHKNGIQIKRPALLTFAVVFGIGIMDEGIQLFLPNRVFDWNDIAFNGIAVCGAVLSLVLVSRLKKKFR